MPLARVIGLEAIGIMTMTRAIASSPSHSQRGIAWLSENDRPTSNNQTRVASRLYIIIIIYFY